MGNRAAKGKSLVSSGTVATAKSATRALKDKLPSRLGGTKPTRSEKAKPVRTARSSATPAKPAKSAAKNAKPVASKKPVAKKVRGKAGK